MKYLSALLLALTATFSTQAFATTDAHETVFIVVQHFQDPEEFFVERAPMIGCYGVSYGPRLLQFTSEYKVPSNIGCGGQKFLDNINVLTCAKVTEEKESSDYMGLASFTLDISKCEAKNNPKFITMIRTAAKLNFPQSDKRKEVQLKLVK